MNNKLMLLLVAVLFAGAYIAGRWLQPTDSEVQAQYSMKHDPCSPARSECAAFIDGHRLLLKFLQPPSALQAFDVQLTTEGLDPQSVQLEFFMQGMDMGVNRYALQPVTRHNWQTKVTLPVCSLGRHDWVVRLKVNYKNTSWLADFSFEQTGN